MTVLTPGALLNKLGNTFPTVTVTAVYIVTCVTYQQIPPKLLESFRVTHFQMSAGLL